LAAASDLTAIQLSEHQYKHGTMQWPTCLPHLQDLFICGTCFDSRCHALPEEWQSYTGLIQFPFIQLPPVEAPLPGWLSKLQKLESLEMAGAIFDAFSTCLSQLFGIKGTA